MRTKYLPPIYSSLFAVANANAQNDDKNIFNHISVGFMLEMGYQFWGLP